MKFGYLFEDEDHLNDYDISEATRLLIQKSREAGHETLIFFKNSILVHDGEVYASVYQLDQFSQKGPVSLSPVDEFNLSNFDLIHPAMFPPMDPSIVYALAFADCEMVNDPLEILRFGEKITPLRHSSLMPWTVVGQNITSLAERMKRSAFKEFIIKPARTYGGKGIELIDLDQNNLEEKLRSYRESIGPMMIIQQKLPVEDTGDKRVIMLEDEILGWEKRVVSEGEVIANYSAGGEIIGCDLTESERSLLEQLRVHFVDFDLPLSGMDVIANKITEVNITNPGGLAFVKQFGDFKTGEKVISYFEKRVKKSNESEQNERQ